MRKLSKRRKDNNTKVDLEKAYPLTEAVTLIKKLKLTKFDETVDVAIRLGVDTRKAEQMVRGTCSMPNGLGKEVRILVFAKGDKVAEAEAAGADFVILGSLLAGTTETPGELFEGKRGKKYKVYRGMASKEAQKDWRGTYSSNEGVSTTVPYKGPVAEVLEDLENGIRSGLSYSGSRTIYGMQFKAQFVKQTNAGQVESSTHILRR